MSGLDMRKIMEAVSIPLSENRGGRYFILNGGGVSEPHSSSYTDTPEDAVLKFFQGQTTSPTDVSISGTKNDMLELLQWAKANNNRVAQIMTQTGADKIFNVPSWIDDLNDAREDFPEHDFWGSDGEEPTGSVHPFTGG